MKQIVLITAVISSGIMSATAQSPDRNIVFDSLNTLTKQFYHERVLEYADQTNALYIFSNDSLAWVQLRYSRSLMRTGHYQRALETLKPALSYRESKQYGSLGIKIRQLHALLLKKLGRYSEALQEFTAVARDLSPDFYEQWAINTINTANTYWELAQYEEYARLTRLALERAVKEGDTRREILTRRNITEYYELRGQWSEAARQLNKLAALVAESGGPRDVARYKIREAVYRRDHLAEMEAATRLLTEARDLSSDIHNFQTWQQASYELVHTLFVRGQLDRVKQQLERMLADERLRQQPAARFALQARMAQFYILTNQADKAGPHLAYVEARQDSIADIEAQAVGYHAQIMYHINARSYSRARDLIARQLDMVLTNQNRVSEGQGVAGSILYLYGKARYQSDNPATLAEIKEEIIRQYIDRKISDWVYERSEGSLSGILIILVCMAVVGVYMVARSGKSKSTDSYRRIRMAVESV